MPMRYQPLGSDITGPVQLASDVLTWKMAPAVSLPRPPVAT